MLASVEAESEILLAAVAMRYPSLKSQITSWDDTGIFRLLLLLQGNTTHPLLYGAQLLATFALVLCVVLLMIQKQRVSVVGALVQRGTRLLVEERVGGAHGAGTYLITRRCRLIGRLQDKKHPNSVQRGKSLG